MPAGTLAGLVICNAIWAANPVMSKTLLMNFSSSQVAWLRYFSATAFFAVVALIMRGSGRWRRRRESPPFFSRPRTAMDLGLSFGMGFSAFCFAPMVGMLGLSRTGAVDNAILIALEPLVTVGLAAVFLSERFGAIQWLSLAVSIGGFSLLSGLAHRPIDAWLATPSVVGNLIIVLSLVGEGGYSIFARMLQGRYASLPLFGTSLALGFAVLTLLVIGLDDLPVLTALELRDLLALAWLGPLGSTLTYLYWVIALEKTDVSSAALTLFVQPVVGALLGVIAFGEPMGLLKASGALLILLAVGLLTVSQRKISD
jgi:drug/metabolite transporter (DMT)-like permease